MATKFLIKHPDGLWRDEHGTIYAIHESAGSVDDKVRAGVGPLSMPEGHWTTDGARSHDYAFSSPKYQQSHTRSEADRMLLDHLLMVAGKDRSKRALAYTFYGLSRAFSWAFWEHAQTRWR